MHEYISSINEHLHSSLPLLSPTSKSLHIEVPHYNELLIFFIHNLLRIKLYIKYTKRFIYKLT